MYGFQCKKYKTIKNELNDKIVILISCNVYNIIVNFGNMPVKVIMLIIFITLHYRSAAVFCFINLPAYTIWTHNGQNL